MPSHGRRSALLWGLIGGLSFLVALQAYELAAAVRVDWAVKLGVAVSVAVVAGTLAPRIQGRIAGRNGQV